MRENKFKVWCKDRNEWEKHSCFMSENGILYHDTGGPLLTALKPDTHIPVFYTDCKDKNGKEIYEGNKINGSIPTEQYKYENGVIEWDDDCAQFTVIFNPDKDTTIDVPLYMFDEIEIIGDIHENPELL